MSDFSLTCSDFSEGDEIPKKLKAENHNNNSNKSSAQMVNEVCIVYLFLIFVENDVFCRCCCWNLRFHPSVK